MPSKKTPSIERAARTPARAAAARSGQLKSTRTQRRRAADARVGRVGGRAAPAPTKRVAKAVSAVVVGEGKRVPHLALFDQYGKRFNWASLDGLSYVLYFYPRDNTPGCTREACSFRDAMGELASVGVRVVGVSPDTVQSHARFAAQHRLEFTLLSDPDKLLAEAFGVWGPKRRYGHETLGIVRSTFLVGPNGVVRRAWRDVRVDGHVEQVMAAVAEL
ncbi:MAG: peroxiredoxin [Polyangiaceae bacterium]|nr:peroxiredoxin [Polyangiaceae bacterium]